MAQGKGAIGAERPEKLVIPKEGHLKEIKSFPFLLPSSLHGPPSPSIYQPSFTPSVAEMSGSLFHFSAISEPFTPTQTRTGTPTATDSQTVMKLQQELIDSMLQINSLSNDLCNSQSHLRAKTGENIQLRNYINTLQRVIEDKNQQVVHSSSLIVPFPLSTTNCGSPKTASDVFFREEFGMLFREIHNFGKGFYKFPTEASIPRELGATMKDMIGDELAVFSLLNDYHTKLLVVAGVVTRFLCLEVFRGGFFEKVVREMGQPVELALWILHGYCNGQCEAVTKTLSTCARVLASRIHSFLLPLMSRPGDQKHCEESFRLLDALIEHASRLWLQITSLGADDWRFSFPVYGSRFLNARMVPCDTRNLGFSGEQEKNNSGLEGGVRGIVFCVLPMIERFVGNEVGEGEWEVLIKASVKVE